jgi:hypothetical protein
MVIVKGNGCRQEEIIIGKENGSRQGKWLLARDMVIWL